VLLLRTTIRLDLREVVSQQVLLSLLPLSLSCANTCMAAQHNTLAMVASSDLSLLVPLLRGYKAAL
jgi:hypothetical protein